MKKTVSFALAALLAASLLAVPAAAETTTFTWDLPHNTPIKHKGLMVMEHTGGVEIGASYEAHESMTSQDIQDAIQTVMDDPEQQIIAAGTKVDPSRVTVIEERSISCPEAPYIVHFRVWGTDNRTVLVFHKAEDADAWQLVLCQTGSDVTPEFPANGTYAVAATW